MSREFVGFRRPLTRVLYIVKSALTFDEVLMYDVAEAQDLS
jgi:hypothetical protein